MTTDLTPAEREMLSLLSCDRPQHTGQLGATMWAHKSRAPRTAAAYARPAGRILNALRRKGLALRVVQGEVYGWVATRDM